MTTDSSVQADRKRRVLLVVKPAITLAIIILAGLMPVHVGSPERWLVLPALVLCLIGDMCLLGLTQKWFVTGLLWFLLAHVLFIVAFAHGLSTFALPWWSIVAIVYAVVFAWQIVPRTGKLWPAVIAYCAVLLAMVLTALWRWHVLGGTASLLVLAGAALFMVSDSLLAIRQFVGKFRFATVLVLATYWLAIGLVAFSL